MILEARDVGRLFTGSVLVAPCILSLALFEKTISRIFVSCALKSLYHYIETIKGIKGCIDVYY